MRPRLFSSLLIALLLPVCAWSRSRRPVNTRNLRNAGNKKINHTIITPILDCTIPYKTNVLWCSTFQLAWNELCKINGGKIKFENPSKLAEALNKQEFTKQDISNDAYVALGGFIQDDIEDKIRTTLKAKFGNQIRPLLLNNLPEQGAIAYTYIYKNLLFQYPFKRYYRHLRFGNQLVDCFGIEDYHASRKKKLKMASQVYILDYKSNDDFIIELQTMSLKDRLILAKIKPGKTLRNTINKVHKRISNANAERLQEDHDIQIPVLKCALGRQYSELLGQVIDSKKSKINTWIITRAAQLIHFKLNEKGAVLKSEALLGAEGGGPPRFYFFDKPFLILLQQKTNRLFGKQPTQVKPYFALWIGNSKLLHSTKIRKTNWKNWPDG